MICIETFEQATRRHFGPIARDHGWPLIRRDEHVYEIQSRSERSANVGVKRVERERQQAESAFKSGDYEKAISIYAQLASVDLTPTDLKRLEIARKKLPNQVS